MKRPRWLGTPESAAADEDNDGDTAEGSARERRGEPVERSKREETAAERSARRTAAGKRPGAAAESSRSARHTLGERVGKAKEGSQGAAGKGMAAEKPKVEQPKANEAVRKPDPETRKDRDEKPRRKSGPRDEKSKESQETRDKKNGDGRELHRPRRQDDDERHRDPKPRRKRGEAARAERNRKPIGRRARNAAGRPGTALKRGAVATRGQVAAAAPKVGLGILTVLGGFYSVFFAVFAFVLGILISLWLFIARPVGWVLARLSRLTDATSRLLTPVRVLGLVVAGAAVLLALSQYADYRSISIGNGAYSDGLQAVAPAPETGRLETGDAHSYVFVPIAIGCLLLLAGALSGRRRLCLPIALAGAAAIVVALVVDRPAGLDPGDTALAFNGADATLLGGFYAQLAAGILLIGSSSLLARELRLAGATRRSGLEAGREGEPQRGARKGALRSPDPDAGGARA